MESCIASFSAQLSSSVVEPPLHIGIGGTIFTRINCALLFVILGPQEGVCKLRGALVSACKLSCHSPNVRSIYKIKRKVAEQTKCTYFKE